MKTKILTLLTLIAIVVASCQKEEAVDPVTTQEVSFSITEVDPNLLKSDPDSIFCPTDEAGNLLVPTVADYSSKIPLFADIQSIIGV